ncbi:hypothetical protein [Nocardia araoensis]|uniref:hypothetical protein n=1 Tax=Nocardia araoensis TaxID=228600 RepID=UPI0002F42AB9|nr:hypothetical protein [Nocardia araoensis]
MAEEANPWSGLSREAQNGTLELRPGVLEALINAANGVRVRVASVKKELSKIDSLPPFAEVLLSAEALASRFSEKGRELGRILDDHITILDDLTDTFFAAARHYRGTEEDNRVDFAALERRVSEHKGITENLSKRWDPAGLTTAGDGSGNTYAHPDWNEVGKRKPEENHGLPTSLAEPGEVKFEPRGVHADDPENFTYSQYQTIISSITGGSPTMPIKVAQAASDWRWLAGELKETFDILTNQMTTSRSSWTSPNNNGGAHRARQAITAYGTGTDQLNTNMKLIGDSLEYVSEWLYTTGVLLQQGDDYPPTRNSGETDDVYRQRKEEAAVRNYVRAMQAAYVPGVEETDKVIAVLPDPIPPTTGQVPGPGPGPGGPGPGAAPGPGTNTAQLASMQNAQRQAEQQRKALEDAQRQAQLDAQRRAAEQQQQQQQAAQQAAQQAQQQAAQQLAQQAQQAAQQIAQQAQQIGQQVASAAQQAAQQASLAGLPGMPNLSDATKKLESALAKGAGGPGGSAGGPGAPKSAANQNLEKASKLFPRAATNAVTAAATGRAGLAAGQGMMGPGMPMGGPGAAQGGQQKEHKRADYLDSTEHLEEALGDAPVVAKPVVEQ